MIDLTKLSDGELRELIHFKIQKELDRRERIAKEKALLLEINVDDVIINENYIRCIKSIKEKEGVTIIWYDELQLSEDDVYLYDDNNATIKEMMDMLGDDFKKISKENYDEVIKNIEVYNEKVESLYSDLYNTCNELIKS